MESLTRIKQAPTEHNWIFPLGKDNYEIEDTEDGVKITSKSEGKVWNLKFKRE